MKESKDIIVRARFIFILAAFFGIIILGKAFSIAVLNRDYWLTKKENQTIRFRTIPAARGNLYSTDGSLLATSLPIYDVRLDLKAEYLDKVFDKEVDSLAICMANAFKDKTAAEYSSRLRRERKAENRYFLLRKGIKYNTLKLMKTFPILRYGRNRGGMIVESSTRREMPFRHLASRTLGTYRDTEKNKDKNVLSIGIEGAYNEYLKGVDGKQLVEKISGGVWRPIGGDAGIEPKEGNDIVTTIDVAIQDVAEAELMHQLQKHNAEHGCVVLMEVETGYIRAIANLGRTKDSSYYENYNYAIGAGTEPGSTFKLASLMALFEDGLASPADVYDTHGGVVMFDNRRMKDSHEGGYGKITLADAFRLSSNTAISQAVHRGYSKNPGKFVDRIKSFGLDKPHRLDIAGEREPLVKTPGESNWYGTTLPWMSIGYETRLTPLQILAFYNAVANNGKMVKPQFVEEIMHRGQVVEKFEPVVIKESICSQKTIDQLKPLLESVVEDGTAKNLRNPFFKIAGKTGTAQIAYESGGYVKDGVRRYQASFVGYFPADKPKYSCIVVVSAPNSSVYYGNLVAGPIFKGVADKVYAKSLDMQNAENEFDFQLASAAGLHTQKRCVHRDDVKKIASQTGVQVQTEGQSNWFTVSQEKDKIAFSALSGDKDEVPDVRGMGLRDALYMLENKGMKVRVNGRGQVKTQSVRPGTKVNKNMVILIELA
ncbi:MAG: transpeptidase family protein [Bacteroidetes bacterium]|nr:transpeptidase family protein [Bacteroidota bacterium]